MNEKNSELLESKDGTKRSQRSGRRRRVKDVKPVKPVKPEVVEEPKAKNHSCRRDAAENDERWYAASTQLLNDAFSLSTPYAVGSALKFDSVIGDALGDVTSEMLEPTKYVAPGICVLHVIPCPGIARYPTDPVNIAAGKVFQWMRHANAGAKVYAPQNLLFYLLAMDNAYMLWNWLTRAYMFMRTYNQTNRYLPKAMIDAMGLDFDSLYANMNDFRGTINLLGSQLASYAVPATMPYFTRHAFMFSNVYTDNQDFKSQLYVYNPTLLYKWVEGPDNDHKVGSLEPIMIKGSRRNYSDVIALIQEIMQGIHSSEDFRFMSGDIIKAYGLNNLLTVPEVQADDMLLPYYEERVLSQIENTIATGAPHPQHLDSLSITEDYEKDCAIFDPVFSASFNDGIVAAEELPLNFHKQDVSPGDVAEATRLMWIAGLPDVTYEEGTLPDRKFRSGHFTLSACGTEICTEITIVKLKSDGTADNQGWINSRTRLDDMFFQNQSLKGLWTFTRHPMICTYSVVPSDSAYSNVAFRLHDIIGEVDNLTKISFSELVRMHEVALYSLFDVPSIGGLS